MRGQQSGQCELSFLRRLLVIIVSKMRGQQSGQCELSFLRRLLVIIVSKKRPSPSPSDYSSGAIACLCPWADGVSGR